MSTETPPTRRGPPVARAPCDPDWHLRTGKNCPACVAWDRNQVLLVDGRCVEKLRWITAHAVDEREKA